MSLCSLAQYSAIHTQSLKNTILSKEKSAAISLYQKNTVQYS